MRKIIVVLLMMISQLLLAQQQQMTLQDAVLGRHTYLLPKTLEGLTWKNDQVYTWEENGTIYAEEAGKEKKLF